MKTFVLAWEEYLWTGNDAILDNLPEGTVQDVLCSGECRLQAASEKEAKRRWRRLFPRSIVLGITEKVC